MPERRPLPNIEKLVLDALFADAAAVAVFGDRMGAELPDTFPDGQRLRVWRVGGSPVDEEPEHLDRPLLQVEAYGETKEDAYASMAAGLDALLGLAGQAVPGAVITKVQRVSGPSWSRDPTTNTPRYLAAVAVYVHAAAPDGL